MKNQVNQAIVLFIVAALAGAVCVLAIDSRASVWTLYVMSLLICAVLILIFLLNGSMRKASRHANGEADIIARYQELYDRLAEASAADNEQTIEEQQETIEQLQQVVTEQNGKHIPIRGFQNQGSVQG